MICPIIQLSLQYMGNEIYHTHILLPVIFTGHVPMISLWLDVGRLQTQGRRRKVPPMVTCPSSNVEVRKKAGEYALDYEIIQNYEALTIKNE